MLSTLVSFTYTHCTHALTTNGQMLIADSVTIKFVDVCMDLLPVALALLRQCDAESSSSVVGERGHMF